MYTVRGQEEAPLSAAEAIASREMIQILLEQRQQVLDEHVEMVRSATSQGGLRMDKLFQAENDAPHASLELAGGQKVPALPLGDQGTGGQLEASTQGLGGDPKVILVKKNLWHMYAHWTHRCDGRNSDLDILLTVKE